MMDNEDLERRSEKIRTDAQFKELRQILDNAKKKSDGWKNILSAINPSEIVDKKSLEKLPITRKASLSLLQNEKPPLGGLTTIPTNQFKNLFVSRFLAA